MTVFVDSSALYALADGADPNHPVASGSFGSLRAEDRLLTHEYVLVETIGLVQRRLGLEAVRLLLDDLLAPVEVEWVDRELHAQARAAMLAAGRRGLSFVDWTSFLVMRRRGIATAFAFDEDFRAQGFHVLPG